MQTNRGFIQILGPILVLIAIIGGGFIYYQQNYSKPAPPPITEGEVGSGSSNEGSFGTTQPKPVAPAPTQPVACTAEAKICPDGSAVGRTGPKCEFAACPVATNMAEIFTDKNGLLQVSAPTNLAKLIGDLSLRFGLGNKFNLRSGSENSSFTHLVDGKQVNFYFEDLYFRCIRPEDNLPSLPEIGPGPDQIHLKKVTIAGRLFCQASFSDSGAGTTGKTYEYITTNISNGHTEYIGVSFTLLGNSPIAATFWSKAETIIEQYVLATLKRA